MKFQTSFTTDLTLCVFITLFSCLYEVCFRFSNIANFFVYQTPEIQTITYLIIRIIVTIINNIREVFDVEGFESLKQSVIYSIIAFGWFSMNASVR